MSLGCSAQSQYRDLGWASFSSKVTWAFTKALSGGLLFYWSLLRIALWCDNRAITDYRCWWSSSAFGGTSAFQQGQTGKINRAYKTPYCKVTTTTDTRVSDGAVPRVQVGLAVMLIASPSSKLVRLLLAWQSAFTRQNKADKYFYRACLRHDLLLHLSHCHTLLRRDHHATAILRR
jgi:hypothetical protein